MKPLFSKENILDGMIVDLPQEMTRLVPVKIGLTNYLVHVPIRKARHSRALVKTSASVLFGIIGLVGFLLGI